MNTPIYRYLFIFLIVAGVSGCGKGFVPLRGTVTFSDDGAPLTTGVVYFDNGKDVARGKINADGTYVVGSMSNNDGLAPGNYKVYVQAMGPDPSGAVVPVSRQPGMQASTPSDSGLRRQVPLIDPKFSSSATSGLECHVDRSTKPYDIVVDRPPNLKRK